MAAVYSRRTLRLYYECLRETITEGSTTTTLDFAYDNVGMPYCLIYNDGTTTTTYYYITNLQGDVMYLVDASGNEVAAYDYDPYGKVITATGAMAEINPLRYRGYYYDSETGFYYLQSRYYDPEICRFINADSYASTGQGVAGCNMFAYCLNNPINRIDTCGFSSFGLFSGIAAMFFGFGFAVSLGTVVTDDYIAIQINYVYSGSMKNNDVQQLGLSMGPTLTLQITDKERLADLEGESTAIGGGGSVGAEVLVDDKGTPFGWQASGGTDGYSKDFHKIKSNTVTIIKIPTINLPRRGKKWWQDTHDS